jgi:hypothetical protein
LELKFLNILRFKVFLGEMGTEEVERLVSLYLALHELSLQMTRRTSTIGFRALDILHVAAARLCEATMFVTVDNRQAALAGVEGRTVKLVPSSRGRRPPLTRRGTASGSL